MTLNEQNVDYETEFLNELKLSLSLREICWRRCSWDSGTHSYIVCVGLCKGVSVCVWSLACSSGRLKTLFVFVLCVFGFITRVGVSSQKSYWWLNRCVSVCLQGSNIIVRNRAEVSNLSCFSVVLCSCHLTLA